MEPYSTISIRVHPIYYQDAPGPIRYLQETVPCHQGVTTAIIPPCIKTNIVIPNGAIVISNIKRGQKSVIGFEPVRAVERSFLRILEEAKDVFVGFPKRPRHTNRIRFGLGSVRYVPGETFLGGRLGSRPLDISPRGRVGARETTRQLGEVESRRVSPKEEGGRVVGTCRHLGRHEGSEPDPSLGARYADLRYVSAPAATTHAPVREVVLRGALIGSGAFHGGDFEDNGI